MGHPVRIPESSISASLHARSREPFTDVLEALIGAKPNPSDLLLRTIPLFKLDSMSREGLIRS